jgi:hypothetical protein
MSNAGGEVRFGGKMTALIGVLGGVAVAAGVPAVVLIYGQSMGWGAQLTVIILALLLGAPISAISAILGIVIPSSASGGGKMRGGVTINIGKGKRKKVRMEGGPAEEADEDEQEDKDDADD